MAIRPKMYEKDERTEYNTPLSHSQSSVFDDKFPPNWSYMETSQSGMSNKLGSNFPV